MEYANAKVLADSGVISPSQLALVQAKLDKARAEAALAASHLQFTSIRAPFEGLIGELKVRLGSLLEEGELPTTRYDPSQLWDTLKNPSGLPPRASKPSPATSKSYCKLTWKCLPT